MTIAPESAIWIGGSVNRPKLKRLGYPPQLMPGEVLLVSTVPSFNVMLDESASIVMRNCTYWPESRMPSPNFAAAPFPSASRLRSEEHTSELQSLAYLVCRLLLEKKKD